LKENAPSNILNPSVAPVVQIFARHNFLQGFGVNVNARFIHVAEKNIGKSRESFRSQLLNLTATVLNLYWDLASTVEEVKTRQRTLEISKKFFEDTNHQIRLGAIARVERFRAEAELKSREQELALSISNQRRQENLLKNVISRTGLSDPRIADIEIVPVDAVKIPDTDELPTLRQLVQTSLAKRPDIAIGKINTEQADISALGTRSGILPQLQGIASMSSQGLAGVSNPNSSVKPDPYFEGNLGTALGQVFRQNFKNRRAAVVVQGLIHNRVAQADYGIEQLQIKQNELIERRSMNQLVVDISNQLVAIRQARSRYTAAKNTRELQEQLLEKEQERFRLGDSTISAIIAAQRAASTAATAEVAARATYSHARVSIEQVTGEILEKNQISVALALDGRAAGPGGK
jgi:outer membrane protein